MDYKDEFAAYLRVYDKRNTPAKQLVFEHLNNHETISTADLYQKVASNMDRATFYRIIKQFRQIKIIHDAVVSGQRRIELSEKFHEHHHHLLCVKCGEVIRISDYKLEQYLKLLTDRKGYTHLNHSFEIQGTCPKCSV